jgi:hypothetical protein
MLACYVATDREHRVEEMCTRFAGHATIKPHVLLWGGDCTPAQLASAAGAGDGNGARDGAASGSDVAFDLVLGSDVVYHGFEGDHNYDALRVTLHALCTLGRTTALICFRERFSEQEQRFEAGLLAPSGSEKNRVETKSGTLGH